MDKVKASEIEKKLAGKKVGKYNISKLLDHGKSAAVFLATKGGNNFAVKIFDDELISKYGDEAQFERIERELGLKDKPHENLVRLHDGGICDVTKNHFIVMEFIQGENLKNCLHEIEMIDVWSYISQLANAAKHLEKLGYAHRDIKPENIMINIQEKKLTLMDLGVIRPLKGSDLTDNDGISMFIGTLQYSSPEYLLRNEVDDTDGWRALTFYQIGAVLHDMIMQVPIFSTECEPYARLVHAVSDLIPEICSEDVSEDLVMLAKCCLQKKPGDRLSMITWENFHPSDEKNDAKARVSKKMEMANLGKEHPNAQENENKHNNLIHGVIDELKNNFRKISTQSQIPLKAEVTTNNSEIVYFDFDSIPKLEIYTKFRVVVTIKILCPVSETLIVNYMLQNEGKNTIREGELFNGAFSSEYLFHGLERTVYECIELVAQENVNG